MLFKLSKLAILRKSETYSATFEWKIQNQVQFAEMSAKKTVFYIIL